MQMFELGLDRDEKWKPMVSCITIITTVYYAGRLICTSLVSPYEPIFLLLRIKYHLVGDARTLINVVDLSVM